MSLDEEDIMFDKDKDKKGRGGGGHYQEKVVKRVSLSEHSDSPPPTVSSSVHVQEYFSNSHSPLSPVGTNQPLTSTPLVNDGNNGEVEDSFDNFEDGATTPTPTSGTAQSFSYGSASTATAKSSEESSTKVSIVVETNEKDEVTTTGVEKFKSSSSIPSEPSSNAVTIIQVQSQDSNSKVESRKEIMTTEKKLTTVQEENNVDVDGLGVTRIKITGESSSYSNTNSHHHQQTATTAASATTIRVLTSSDSNTDQQCPPTIIVRKDSHHEEEGGRGPMRFDEGIAGMGSQPSDLNDTMSEVSSVVNNPSVISQMPDRYGFMGGEQYTHESEPDPSPELVRRREMKWLQMLDKWDHYMRKEFKTVRSRCRKGVPRSVRGRAWYYLCGAAFIKKKEPDLYFRLLEQEGKPSDIEDIKKDLHRQFPWHEIFAEEGHGKMDLFNVLKAHSILNAKDGYCQAQAPIASILLMHMPAEDAFWCLVAICDKYLKGYYSPGMEQVQLDGDILFGLLKRVAPPVYKHMKKQKIDPVLYMTEWFLCAFTRTLPWSSVLRVWDSFLCEGVKVLFRVGLILMKYTLGRPGVLKQCPSMYETLATLKNLPNYVTHEQFLMSQIQRLDISDDQMRREHYKQVVKRKKAQQKLEAAKNKQQKTSGSSSIQQGVYRSHETSL